MMLSTKEPRRTGIVTRLDVPLNRYLGAAWEQGVEDSAFSAISHMTENIIYSEGNRISPEEANKKYAVEGLNFQTPVYENVARMMRDRHQRRLDRELMMESTKTFSGRWWGGMGVGVLASFTNPLDFALNFMPIVGSERAAASVGRGAFRQNLARGLISEEALAASRVPFPRLAGAFIEGAAGQAIAEVPLRIYKEMNLENYPISDSFINIAAGSILGGGIHLGVTSAARLFRKLHPETKKVLFQQAVEQFLAGESINVHKFVELDEAKIRERVAFDRFHAETEAALNLNEADIKKSAIKKTFPEKVIAAAIRDEKGKVHIGPSHYMIFETFQEGSVDGFLTNYGRFMSREDTIRFLETSENPKGEGSRVVRESGYTGDWRDFHVANPNKRDTIFSEDFDFFDDSVVAATGKDAPDSKDWPELRTLFLQKIRSEYQQVLDMPEMKEAIEAERQKRIQEFVNQRRAEYDPDQALKNEVLAEIDRQKVEGRILHPDEATKWGFTREEMQKTETLLNEDVETLKKELGLDEKLLEEDAKPLKPVPENLNFTVQAPQDLGGGKMTPAIVQIELVNKADPANNERLTVAQLKSEYGVDVSIEQLKTLPQGKHSFDQASELLGIKTPPTPEELAFLRSVPEAEADMIDAAVDCLTKNIT
jgi:hypothetical protein